MNLSQIAIEFYREKLGDSNLRSDLNTLKRLYYIDQLGGGDVRMGTDDLERNWLRFVISDNGGTPSGNFTSDLLKQALVSLDIPPTPQTSQNWQLLYRAL